jgi:hypothetical protein
LTEDFPVSPDRHGRVSPPTPGSKDTSNVAAMAGGSDNLEESGVDRLPYPSIMPSSVVTVRQFLPVLTVASFPSK